MLASPSTLVAIFVATSLLCFAQTPVDSCTASPEERQIHAEISKSAQPVELLRNELKTHPDSLFLNRWFIENKQTATGSLSAEYRKKLDEHPGSPLYLYLYGRALMGANTAEAIPNFNRAIVADPKLPWSYYSLLEVYSSPNFKDPAKLADNLLTFSSLCPDVLSGYRFIRFVEDHAKLRELAQRFRRAVENNTTKSAAGSYPLLWAAEFRVPDPSAFESLRAQVAKDIERLKQLAPDNTAALREGYKLIGDSAAANALRDKPRAPKDFHDVFNAWSKEHPFPNDKTSQKEVDRFNTERLKASEQWVKDWPDDPYAWQWRLSSLADVKSTSNQEIEKTGDALLDALKKHPFKGYLFKPYQAQVAEVWNRRDIRLEECVRLAEEALVEIDRGPTFLQPANDMRRDYSAEFVKSHALSIAQGRFETFAIEADALRKLKNYKKAGDVLGQMKSRLDENPGDDWELTYLYFSQRALLAEAEGHKLDALTYYQRLFSRSDPNPEDRTHVLALWKEMGGTDEGFQLWSSREEPKESATVNQVSAWSEMDKPLTALNASDLGGKKWTIADLRGKATLLNLWATWCAPCRDELPDVEKLYEQVKERKDIQVLSINVDDNPGKIGPFLKGSHYTFPVILAQSFVNDFAGQTLPIPRTWIVDSNGSLRLERVGYNPADWPQAMLEKLTTLK